MLYALNKYEVNEIITVCGTHKSLLIAYEFLFLVASGFIPGWSRPLNFLQV